MLVCKQTPKKNVQLVNCPSENTSINCSKKKVYFNLLKQDYVFK